jgi:DNA (cytosine-5)-methyltransferase 1
MWDIARFAEQAILLGHPLQAIVVENVVDAFKWGADDDGGLFNAWLTAIDSLGYEHEIVWLNSMFAPPAPDPAPQSRDRMYVVFWRKGIRRPNLRVEPPAWCPHCERLVYGQQTWKKPDQRPWGRYGAQYLYGCPDCHARAAGRVPGDLDHRSETCRPSGSAIARGRWRRTRGSASAAAWSAWSASRSRSG